MKSVGTKTDEINHTWRSGTAVLGELADQISEFRLAETYYALSRDSKAGIDAKNLMDKHRHEIEEMQDEYEKLVGSKDTELGRAIDAVRVAWAAYESAHNDWIKGDPTSISFLDLAGQNSSLHGLYRKADEVVDELISLNTDRAEAAQRAAKDVVDSARLMAIGTSIATMLLAIWLLIRIRSTITHPLKQITTALTELASGSRDVAVPAHRRDDEIGKMVKAFAVFRANTLALERAHEVTRKAQEEANTLSRRDALTGLSNRRVFTAELQTAFERARSRVATYSVLLIDLDRFKEINDLHGHAVGDAVLREVAVRLEGIVRSGDTVARLGGDEFAIIAIGEPDVDVHIDGARGLAIRVIGALSDPIRADGKFVEVGASVGIAICRAEGVDAAGLLRAADIAMYGAKKNGRGTFRFFEQSMEDDLRAQAALERDIRKAVGDEAIRPFYQPLVEIKDQRIYGFEVLARWDHPDLGSVSPATFIPIVEQLGLMSDLSASMLRQACRDARHWPDDIRLSVNISPSELKDPTLSTRILSILDEEKFSPGRLDVEITETALVSDTKMAKVILSAFQSRGISVSLDDFGTGYSSLYHLKELNFDKIKIDQSFIQAMGESKESEKIVDAILGLTRNLNLPTVAEGVENVAVWRQLAAKGCVYGQGYLFGKAVSAAGVANILEGRATNADRVRTVLRDSQPVELAS